MARNNTLYQPLLGDESKISDFLAKVLNNGQLSLLLGAGVSMGLGLPSWKKLVEDCANSANVPCNNTSNMSPEELKKVTDNVKGVLKSHYLDTVQDMLYKGISLNFETAKKDLLIALSSLMIGKHRGNVRAVLTYNFDSILEWYLQINGLKVRVLSEHNMLKDYVDVEIIHLHGFLPHPNMVHQQQSNFLVFSRKEFESRKLTQDNFWKNEMYSFFKSSIFLTVGISPETMLDDICDYLDMVDVWYDTNQINREKPYGISIFTNGSLVGDQKNQLFKNGIISLEIDKDKIPQFIFNISQQAAGETISSVLS